LVGSVGWKPGGGGGEVKTGCCRSTTWGEIGYKAQKRGGRGKKKGIGYCYTENGQRKSPENSGGVTNQPGEKNSVWCFRKSEWKRDQHKKSGGRAGPFWIVGLACQQDKGPGGGFKTKIRVVLVMVGGRPRRLGKQRSIQPLSGGGDNCKEW